MKKVLSIVLSLVLVICMMPVMAFAGSNDAVYSDIAGEKCEGAVSVLSALGVVDGYENGTYKPEQTVTRAEMAKLVITALGMDSYATATKSSYSDMANAQWAIPVVEYATNLGIIEGVGGGRFSPGNPVTYEQAVTMIVRALGYTTDCNEMNGTWPAVYVQKATALGIFKNVEGNKYGAGANRGDVAIMLYNALDVPQVYADKDGQTLEKKGEYNSATKDYDKITMMSILNKDGSDAYGILSSSDVDGAMADVRAYIGAAAKITKDKNGDVIALGDIKTTFLTGKYNKDNTFTVGDTDYICYPKYKAISKSGVASTVNAAVRLENGITKTTYNVNGAIAANGATLAAGDTVYTIAATVDGKTITGIYSIATWTADADGKITSSNLTQLSKNDKLLSKEFKKDNNGEIDTNAFVLAGVDSLDKIAEDNIVYVYTDGKNVTKVEVGTETVTGEITKKYTDKITIDGKTYKFSTLGDVTASDEMFTAGNEVKLFLDYSGKIYAAELVNGMAGNYAVVIDATEADGDDTADLATGLDAKALKVKMILADGTVKTFEANASKLNDVKDFNVKAWNDATDIATLVTYELNSSDQIVNIAAVEKSGSATNAKVSAAGYYNGYAIADNAAIFKVDKETTKDSDYAVISKDSLAGTSKVTADYKLNKAGTEIAAMKITYSSDSTKLYGILNSGYKNTDGDNCADGFVGAEELADAVINTGAYTAHTLFEMTKTGSGEYDIEPISEAGVFAGENVSVKSNALYNDANRVKAFADKAVVYVYDAKAKAYKVGDLSDVDAAVADDYVHFYLTEADTTKDNYDMITYVVINQEASKIDTTATTFPTYDSMNAVQSPLADGNHSIGGTHLSGVTDKWEGSTYTVTLPKGALNSCTVLTCGQTVPALVQYIKVADHTASVDLYQNGAYSWTAEDKDTQWLDTKNGYAKIATTLLKDGKPVAERLYTLVQKNAEGEVIGSISFTLKVVQGE